MDNARNHYNIIKRLFCLFLVLVSIIMFMPKPKAEAIAGIDDAFLFGILSSLIFGAAGATLVTGINSNEYNTVNPISESLYQELMYQSQLQEKYGDVSNSTFSEDIEFIDWDNVIRVVSGQLVFDVPKSIGENIVELLKNETIDLGATSDTSVDWNNDAGNLASTEYLNIDGVIAYDTPTESNPIQFRRDSVWKRCFVYDYTDPVFVFCTSDYQWFGISDSYFKMAIRNGVGDSEASLNTKFNKYICHKTYFSNYVEITIPYSDITYDEFVTYLESDNASLDTDELTMTLVPESDTEAMVYPESAVTDYPNVESIPYYTDIPYTGTVPETGVIPWADAFPFLKSKLLANELDGAYAIQLEPEPPYVPDQDENVDKPIYIPIIDIPIPTFDFSLGSIWEYVIRWVNSLGDWLGKMFTVWGYLPAPMIYPIWATAVIVIVIGVYKRFFM